MTEDMKEFKGTSLNDRLQLANKSKRALLEKMRAMPKVGDPEVIERRDAKIANATERAADNIRRAEAKSAKARERAEREAAGEFERLAAAKRETEAKAKADAELLAQQKAARDARYAARKNRKPT